jgi:hypothetical protein
MDAGIGPAGAVHDHLVSDDAANGLLDGVLHGALARLLLPAVEVGAVVGQQQADVAHESDCRWMLWGVQLVKMQDARALTTDN